MRAHILLIDRPLLPAFSHGERGLVSVHEFEWTHPLSGIYLCWSIWNQVSWHFTQKYLSTNFLLIKIFSNITKSIQFSSVQSLSHVRLFATPWTAACQSSLSITNTGSPPKPMSIVLVMSSNHLILCCPLLLLPSIFSSIRVFSNESALRIRWLNYWSFSFNIGPSNEHPGLISFRMD